LDFNCNEEHVAGKNGREAIGERKYKLGNTSQ